MIRHTGGLAIGAISTRSSCRFGPRPGVHQGNNSELLTVFTNQADFGSGDFRVDPLMLVEGYCLFSNGDKKGHAPREAHPHLMPDLSGKTMRY